MLESIIQASMPFIIMSLPLIGLMYCVTVFKNNDNKF